MIETYVVISLKQLTMVFFVSTSSREHEVVCSMRLPISMIVISGLYQKINRNPIGFL